MKILITGAAGKCGSCLWDLDHKLVLLDKEIPSNYNSSTQNPQNKWVKGNICDSALMSQVIKGCSVIIHLSAANGKMHEESERENALSWDEIQNTNIESLKMILDLAKLNNVDRIIYASSNHIFGNVELENKSLIYKGNSIKVKDHDQYRPDSLYGVSKVFGELIGRFYAEQGGPKFYSLRIGSLLSKEYNTPKGYAEEGVDQRQWTVDSKNYLDLVERTNCCWLSRRDFKQLINKLLHYEGNCFDTFFGISDNEKTWFDMSETKDKLGYKPQDSAENY